MIQGTGSNVGKSVVATALCRVLAQDGYITAPFKSQNMALNSFVTKEGGEMGRAQVVQALAARIEPHVDMNPILLKPTGDMKSQVIVSGKPIGTMRWSEYRQLRDKLFAESLAAYSRLARRCQAIVIEGAGSPAEVNLKEGDIVNMRIALATGAPVFLVTDIDRGGALAWVIGTLELLPPEERALVRGIIINKFRGDKAYLQPGLDFLEKRTGIPVVGVMPYVKDLGVAAEDSVALEDTGTSSAENSGEGRGVLHIAVIRLPLISNFTDFDALAGERDVSLRFVPPGAPLRPADCVIIPGSKNTLHDLDHLWSSGTAAEIQSFAAQGGCVLGICGGYQMLGLELNDPEGVESSAGRMAGLGLLPVRTTLAAEKTTYQVSGSADWPIAGFWSDTGAGETTGTGRNSFRTSSLPIRGYEIHCGHTVLLGGNPWITLERHGTASGKDPGIAPGIASGAALLRDGCLVSTPVGNGFIAGTYVHGLFDEPPFRRAFLNHLRRRKGWEPYESENGQETDAFDRLAELARKNLDIPAIYQAMNLI
ncbi:MAG TPA: cobyric acid synthase [Firmicutes bacterium]|nr:cobyric acid synthase [Bacillota bacterium]